VPAKKCSDKNRRKKLRKKVFYIHTNIVTKNGREKSGNNFSSNTPIMREIYVGEKKSLEKSAKTRFYIHTNIVTKKWGEKNARTIFQETHQ